MSARPAQNIDTANIVGHYINGRDVADANRPGRRAKCPRAGRDASLGPVPVRGGA